MKNLRCLVCQGQTVQDSNSEFALIIKSVVKDKVEEGSNEKEIYNTPNGSAIEFYSPENKNNDICQQSFTHFQGNGKGNVYWGSEKPMKEVCLKDLQAHTGTPNHSIWNNSTKRKTIVDRVV